MLYVWHNCKFPFFGGVITRDLVHSVDNSPVFKILLHTEVRTSIIAFSSDLTNCAGMLSTPDDFPTSNVLTAGSYFSSRIGKALHLVSVGSQVLLDLHQPYSRKGLSSTLSICLFIEELSWLVLYVFRFSLFLCDLVFH